MGYERALEAAGAEILHLQYFGSYQGDLIIIAKVNGDVRYYCIPYGSCSGCDDFQASEPSTPEELRVFGERYIDDFTDYEGAIERAKRNLNWDMEAADMVKWLEEHKE